MKRHFNSRHENMKFNSPLPPLPPQEGYVYTPPPPPPQEGYIYTPPPPRGPELSSLHQTETEEPYFIYSTDDPFVFKVTSKNPTLIISMLDKYN